MADTINVPDLPLEPVGLGAEPDLPRQFAGSLADRTVAELEQLIQDFEIEVAQATARSQVRRELDEVVWELERRETDRRTQERRQSNLHDLRDRHERPVTSEPSVWVHGRPLDDRERQDLVAFIRWVVRGDA